MSKSNWFIYLSTFNNKKGWNICQQPFYTINENTGQLVSSMYYQEIIPKNILLKKENYYKNFSYGVAMGYSYEELKQILNNSQSIANSSYFSNFNIYKFSISQPEFIYHVEDLKINESKRIPLTKGINKMEIHVLYTNINEKSNYVISTPSYSIHKYKDVNSLKY
jgi:hypothetical protein